VSAEPLGIGFIGTSWMGRVHAHALHTIGHVAPLERPLRLVSIAGRDPARTERTARLLGFASHTTRWEEVVEDPRVDVVANLGPNELHREPCIAALAAGKSVLCEKPLGANLADSEAMLAAARSSDATTACGFNYRFVPAVRLARELVQRGDLGDLRRFSATYLQDWASSPALRGIWRFAGSGVLDGAVGDYAHIVDLMRHLAGEPRTVYAQSATFFADRRTEDAYSATATLDGGVLATLQGSRVAIGWKGKHAIELNGSKGSLWWDMEDLNRLHVALDGDRASGLYGFRDVLVTEREHPFQAQWWAPGHVLGWEHSFTHQWQAFLEAVIAGAPAPPEQASFADGARADAVCTAILESARTGQPQTVEAV
jgi:predicted dehydrogenase